MSGLGLASFVLRRLLWGVFLLVVASIAVFVVFWLMPANPAAIRPASAITSAEAQAMTRHFLSLDQPIWQRYLTFLWRMVRYGSLGHSYVSRQTVDSIIATDAPVTGSLVVGGAVIWLSTALPLGILAALRPGSLLDRGSTVFILLGLSAHPVWVGLLLAYLVGFRLGVTPIQGYCNFFGGDPTQCSGPTQWAYHLVLPWVTFALLFAALYLRLIRAMMIESLSEDYVRTARAKGASERRVVMRHALRNSLAPVVTIFGMDLGLALGSAIFVKNIFGLPGLGYEVIHAYQFDDYPVIVGVVMFGAVSVVTFNVLVDIAYAFIDPRVRLAS